MKEGSIAAAATMLPSSNRWLAPAQALNYATFEGARVSGFVDNGSPPRFLGLNMGTPTPVPNGLSYPSRQRDVPQLRIFPLIAATVAELALAFQRSDR